MRERLQKQRHQFGKDFPRARSAHGGTAAEVPAPDRLGGVVLVDDTQLLVMAEQFVAVACR